MFSLPEYFWSCTRHRVSKKTKLCSDVCVSWMFVVAANSHDWCMMRSHIKQTFQVFYHWSIMGTLPLMMNLDFTLLHILNYMAQNNANLLFRSNFNVKCFITAWVEMNNIQYVHPKCQITLMQPFISKDAILHWNLIPIITLLELFPITRKWKMLSVCQRRSTMSCMCNPITNTLVKVGSLWECSTAATTVMSQLYALKQA